MIKIKQKTKKKRRKKQKTNTTGSLTSIDLNLTAHQVNAYTTEPYYTNAQSA